MITRLKVSNFKSHKDTELQLRNLTLLTGINGCGKTSVLQALLLLRQSYKKNRLMQGLDLNNPLVNIGIGNEALSQFAESGDICFEMDEDGQKLVFRYDATKSLSASFIPVVQYSDNIKEELLKGMSLFNNDFQYISALRWGGRSNFPKDTYTVETEGQMSNEKGQCELIGNFLHYYSSKLTYDYRSGNEERPLSLLDQVIYWEQLISPGVYLRVEPSVDNTSYNVLYDFLSRGDAKPVKNLRAENIGFGISYTLPVITALVYAERGSLLMIENPEAHLHPDGQVELARLMALAAQRGVQLIIETHSDHIINGVLKSCLDAERGGRGIERDNVAVYYFGGKDNRNVSLYEEVKVVEGGQLEYQPKGFFDQIEAYQDYLNSYYEHD